MTALSRLIAEQISAGNIYYLPDSDELSLPANLKHFLALAEIYQQFKLLDIRPDQYTPVHIQFPPMADYEVATELTRLIQAKKVYQLPDRRIHLPY